MPEQIDAMLVFLAIFEREGFVAAELIGEPGYLPYYKDTIETGAFRPTIQSSGLYCLGKPG